jgi:protein involved in plasmid replication-relaxation
MLLTVKARCLMRGNNKKLVLLQQRDKTMLAELVVMRVIDRELAKAVAGFGSTTRANSRLLALTQAGYLKRSFVGTIFGGRKAVYLLSTKGLAIGNAANHSGPDNAGKTSYSGLFLEHQLRINQVYVWVKHQPIPFPGCRFHRWISFNRPMSKSSPIVPDGYFEIQHEAVITALFLEVDLGTEALRIWQKKIEGYLKFAVAGEFKKLSGLTHFKLLVIARSERRAESIRQLAAKLTDKIFRFTSFETINREGFWSAIWQKPVGGQKESLL